MTTRLVTLGGLGLTVGTGTVDWLETQRLRAGLLVYLAVERSTTRDALQSIFWPEADAASAAGRLKSVTYELRRVLGVSAVETNGRTLRAGDSLFTDVVEFETAIAEQRPADAIALYRGPFLSGIHLVDTKAFESWVDHRRARYAREFRKACRTLLEARLVAGDAAGALTIAHAWVTPDPTDDEAQHHLIKLLAQCHGRADALEQYAIYRRLLEADGLLPLEQTRALVAAIEAQREPVGGPIRATAAQSLQTRASLDASVGARQTAPNTSTPPGAAGVDVVSGKTRDVAQRTPLPRGRRWTLSGLATAGAIFVAVAGGGFWSWEKWLAPTPERCHVRSVAVLPFQNFSSDKEKTEYRSDGLTEELINALSQIKGLSVPARTSSFAFKGQNTDIKEIGRKLHVDAVVEGSYQLEGTKQRVIVQLISVKDGFHCWGKPYVRELQETFAVQDEIVRAIVDALAIELGAGDSARLAIHYTENLDAYDLYQEGRSYLNKETPEAMERARQLFKQAITRDATFALPYAALAETYITRNVGSRYIPRAEICANAMPAIEKAFALDSGHYEVLTVHGRLRQACNDDIAGAVREYKRALAINPNYSEAHVYYDTFLPTLGRPDEGIRELRNAIRRDPSEPRIRDALGRVFILTGRYDSALVQFKNARDLDSTWTASDLHIARAHLHNGDLQQARANLESAHARLPKDRLAHAYLGYVEARLHNRARAIEILHQLEQRTPGENVWDAVAIARLGLGDKEGALAALGKAIEDPHTRPVGVYILLASDPILDELRADPRLEAMRARLAHALRLE